MKKSKHDYIRAINNGNYKITACVYESREIDRFIRVVAFNLYANDPSKTISEKRI